MEIAIASDRRLYDYTKVLINNLVKTQPNLNHIHVFLEDDELPDYNTPECVKYYNANNYSDFVTTMDKIAKMTEVGPLACIRCWFPDILKDLDKVIYLDIDILVRKPLDELWNLDIENYYIAAVEDLNIRLFWQSCFVGIEEEEYINSGVLLMNLKKMRQDNLVKKMKFLLTTVELKFLDQDALNIACNKKIYYIDTRFNSSYISGEVSDPFIYHGVRIKPWLLQCKWYDEWVKNKE